MRFFMRFQNVFFHFTTLYFKKFFILFAVICIFLSIYNLAHCFQLSLAWDPNTEPDVAGYKVYYGMQSRQYDQAVDVGNYESVTISGLELNKTYYFAVTAYDMDENESDASNEISYRKVVDSENEPPTADAGADQTVDEHDYVLLDGSYSSDPDDGIATYLWDQVEGTPVVLSDSGAIKPSFYCPEVDFTGGTLVYKLTVTDHGGLSTTDTVTIDVNDINDNSGMVYCESTSTNPNIIWIGNVTLGEFSKSSDASGYSDFTYEEIEVQKGKSYPVSLSAEPANPFYKVWRIFADLNQDGDFSDPGENLFESSGRDAVNGQITVPATAIEGNTRMRISMGLYSYANSCGNMIYGEVEDYTLIIGEH